MHEASEGDCSSSKGKSLFRTFDAGGWEGGGDEVGNEGVSRSGGIIAFWGGWVGGHGKK